MNPGRIERTSTKGGQAMRIARGWVGAFALLLLFAFNGALAGGCAYAAKAAKGMMDEPSLIDPGDLGGLRNERIDARLVPVALAEMPAAPGDTATTRPRAARDVVYSAAFRVVVANVPG